MKQKLLVFERKILRGIFGPTKELSGTWRIKTNSELNKLIKNQTIINFIKAQRLSWLGHIHRMDSDRMVKKYEWKPTSTRPQGRPKFMWENDISNDLKEMKVNNWRICIQDRYRWKSVVRRPRLLIYEVVVPEDEDDDDDEEEEEQEQEEQEVVVYSYMIPELKSV
jgi:hypothetical protein